MVWDAALTLAGYLLKLNEKTPKFLENKKVLELGSGIGLCGMLAAALGAEVTLTDMKDSLDLLRHNVEENRKRIPYKATVKELIWSEESAEELRTTFDYVLVADCIYYKESIEPLVESLRVLVGPTTTLIISQELRESQLQIDLCKEFLGLVKKFLTIREIPRSEQHENYQCEEIMLFTCRKK